MPVKLHFEALFLQLCNLLARQRFGYQKTNTP